MRIKPISITILIVITLISCSTENGINDYIKSELESNGNKENELILAKEKISVSEAVNTLKGMGIKKKDGTIVYSGTKILNNEDLKTIKWDTITEYWSGNEFKDIHFIVKNNEKNEIYNYIKSSVVAKNNSYIYYISKPIYLKNNEYMFFYISKSSFADYGFPIYKQVVLMKKEQEKWMVVEKINSTDLN